jgi:hypothetical protein
VTATPGALDTDAGSALAGEVTELLESELVRFVHRVHHDHGVALDRARAALALLTALIRGEVPWTARPDCAPARIAAAFTAFARRESIPAALATELLTEVDSFVTASVRVAVVDEPARTTAALLRRVGAAPELWWWATRFDADHGQCWQACVTASDRVVQVALAVGIEADLIGRALAGAFTVGATRAKTRRTAQRNDLVALLGRLVASGAAVLDQDRELVAKVTALAFEMTAAQAPWWTGAGASAGNRTRADGVADVAVLTFQLLELFTAIAAGREPDPERYGELAARADETLSGKALRVGALLQRELDPAFAAAVQTRLAGQ